MVTAAQLQKRSLECLRLASACSELADGVSDSALQLHFIGMARFWNALADESMGETSLADMECANMIAA